MSKVLFVTALVASVASAACAQAQSPWYVSGDLGGYFREGFTKRDPLPPLATPGSLIVGSERVAMDPGLTGHLAVGYRVAPHWRVEAELGFADEQVSKVYPSYLGSYSVFNALSTGPLSSGGGDQRLSEGVNIYYDFNPVWSRLTPYAGAGVGVWEGRENSGEYGARTVMVNGQTIAVGPVTLAGGSETEGFGMVEGGVNVRLTRHWSIVPAYRYVHAFDPASKQGGDVAHVAKLGVRYTF